ncbi:MAG: metalloregulator ArsR/SmtB family transcription factor [Magnetococcales bacterium]|nr:metalloregulator ArsR/SmtB family transcription factor [Magnetococcales bacterium]
MSFLQPATLFKSLADETRLRCLVLLELERSLCVCELGYALGESQPKISRHLALLRQSRMVLDHREGLWVHYRINPTLPDWVREVLRAMVAGSHGLDPFRDDLERLRTMTGRPGRCAMGAAGPADGTTLTGITSPSGGLSAMTNKIFGVLFLCTGNSARSILAEGILGHLGHGRFRAFSAGSHPTGRVNPHALKTLETAGIATDGFRSKSWEEFSGPGAPAIDFVFTVCDQAAQEVCPVWPGHPVTANWGVSDPAAVTGSDVEKAAAFLETFRMLHRRISIFVNLPFASLDRLSLQTRVNDIGRS